MTLFKTEIRMIFFYSVSSFMGIFYERVREDKNGGKKRKVTVRMGAREEWNWVEKYNDVQKKENKEEPKKKKNNNEI